VSEWPKVGDSLFGPGPWSSEGILGAFPSHEGLGYYAAAYKEAAEELVQAVLDQRAAADSAIYPILYLYRHYVELMLKEIIYLGEALEKKRTASGHEHHSVDKLWREVRQILERTFPEGQREGTDSVERVVLELAKIDPSGEAFRYPWKRKKTGGGTTWPNSVQLNLENLRQVIRGVSALLDGSCDAMDEMLRTQADMDADLAAEGHE
jgi:hypothetical protein